MQYSGTSMCASPHQAVLQLCVKSCSPEVQGEEEAPGDILDEELQKQLNEIADYDSADEAQPTIEGQIHWTTCRRHQMVLPRCALVPLLATCHIALPAHCVCIVASEALVMCSVCACCSTSA